MSNPEWVNQTQAEWEAEWDRYREPEDLDYEYGLTTFNLLVSEIAKRTGQSKVMVVESVFDSERVMGDYSPGRLAILRRTLEEVSGGE